MGRTRRAWLLLLLLGTGCFGKQQPGPGEDDALPVLPRQPDLARLGWRQVAVVAPVNRAGVALSGTFTEAVVRQLRQRRWPLLGEIQDRPSEAHPPRAWWEQQARRLGVDGFLTGTVTALRWDPRMDRAYASATWGLVDSHGDWLWSRRVAGLSAGRPLPPGDDSGQNGGGSPQAAREGGRLVAAMTEAAKEFALDFRIPD